MKVGINTFGCDHGRSGFGSYIHSLVRNIPESGFSVDLFGPELDRFTYTSGIDSVNYSGLAVSDSILAERTWHVTGFPSFVRKQKYNAVLFPAGTRLMPLKFETVPIVVIQDIVSDMYRTSDQGILTGLFRMQLKKVPGIIAASGFIKDDLVRLGVDESRIRVIYNGIDTSLFYPRQQTNNEAVLIHPFSIRRPYIIYASRVLYPSKCHVELVRAFEIFKKRTGAPHRLVIAGADGSNAEIVHREVIKSPFSSDILLTGYFPHQSLPELYSAADACVFPAAAEGVGLPVLEAMACGIPVACAESGALPEIAGNGALFFDQTNPESIADSISRIVRLPSGENESFRNDLIDKGMSWVNRFSWKRCAEETFDFISEKIR